MEFRQHEGCLDGDRVVAWVQTTAGIVEFAQSCNQTTFTELVTAHARLEDASKETYSVVDLLLDIRLDEPARFYHRWLTTIPPKPTRRENADDSSEAQPSPKEEPAANQPYDWPSSQALSYPDTAW
jgi:hypothetical protein